MAKEQMEMTVDVETKIFIDIYTGMASAVVESPEVGMDFDGAEIPLINAVDKYVMDYITFGLDDLQAIKTEWMYKLSTFLKEQADEINKRIAEQS